MPFGQQAASPLAVPGQFGQFAPTNPTALQGAADIFKGARPGLAAADAEYTAPALALEGDPGKVLEPAQGFFGRMLGAKGSDKRSDISNAMIAAGARMMQGSTDGTFATIGEGLETGLDAYQGRKEDRRVQEDRDIVAADRARETKVREDLETALATMAETGELTPSQMQIALGIGSSDPTAGIAALEGFKTENATTTSVTNFLGRLDPDALAELEESGGADLLRESSSVFSNDQKLDMMLTIGAEAKRREDAIDPLLWRLENIDNRSLATPEQLERARFIARNSEYTERMLTSPINWRVIDDENQVHYYRDDIRIESFDKAVDDPVVSPAAMMGFEEFYTNERNSGRRELYTWKRGIDAVDRMKDEAFGERARGLRRAWKTFQNYANSDLSRGEALANLEASWAELGFANLSSFVGPTSDYEFGIAQALSGTRELTRAELKKHMTQLYRQKLDDIAMHNDRLLKQVPDQEIRDLYLIRLSPEDWHEDTRRYFDDRLGSEQSTEGHRILLSGVRSWTGALQDLGPGRVPRPGTVPEPGTVPPDSVIARPDSLQTTFDTLSALPITPDADIDLGTPLQQNGLLAIPAVSPSGGEWMRTGEERGFGNPLQSNMFKWERRDEFGKLLDSEWIKDGDVPWVN